MNDLTPPPAPTPHDPPHDRAGASYSVNAKCRTRGCNERISLRGDSTEDITRQLDLEGWQLIDGGTYCDRCAEELISLREAARRERERAKGARK